jgi:hypothetical protein
MILKDIIMNKNVFRPVIVKDEHIEYLNNLRDSGATNMFGARPYLQAAFGDLSKQEALIVLTYWMDSFDGE